MTGVSLVYFQGIIDLICDTNTFIWTSLSNWYIITDTISMLDLLTAGCFLTMTIVFYKRLTEVKE